MDKNDPTESTEPADPTPPIESTEPIDATDNTELREPIDRSESREHSDHREPFCVIFTVHLPCLVAAEVRPGFADQGNGDTRVPWSRQSVTWRWSGVDCGPSVTPALLWAPTCRDERLPNVAAPAV